MLQKEISVQLIKYQSREYKQACELRYRLFFAEHGLPWEIVLDDNDINFHAAIIVQNNVVAYGQLIAKDSFVYQVKQMVVEPKYQKQNLGRQILQSLINIARQQGATDVTLNARLFAVGFYQKLGFQTYGSQFPSATTGVIHIPMRQKL